MEYKFSLRILVFILAISVNLTPASANSETREAVQYVTACLGSPAVTLHEATSYTDVRAVLVFKSGGLLASDVIPGQGIYQGRLQISRQGKVVLSGLRLEDSGMFRIEIARNAGHKTAVSVVLVLREPPSTKDGKLHVTRMPSPSNPGQLKLSCGHFTSTGYPPAAVLWRDPKGRLLSSTNLNSATAGDFLLDLNPSYAPGNYTCFLHCPPPHHCCLPPLSPLRRPVHARVAPLLTSFFASGNSAATSAVASSSSAATSSISAATSSSSAVTSASSAVTSTSSAVTSEEPEVTPSVTLTPEVRLALKEAGEGMATGMAALVNEQMEDRLEANEADLEDWKMELEMWMEGKMKDTKTDLVNTMEYRLGALLRQSTADSSNTEDHRSSVPIENSRVVPTENSREVVPTENSRDFNKFETSSNREDSVSSVFVDEPEKRILSEVSVDSSMLPVKLDFKVDTTSRTLEDILDEVMGKVNTKLQAVVQGLGHCCERNVSEGQIKVDSKLNTFRRKLSAFRRTMRKHGVHQHNDLIEALSQFVKDKFQDVESRLNALEHAVADNNENLIKNVKVDSDNQDTSNNNNNNDGDINSVNRNNHEDNNYDNNCVDVTAELQHHRELFTELESSVTSLASGIASDKVNMAAFLSSVTDKVDDLQRQIEGLQEQQRQLGILAQTMIESARNTPPKRKFNIFLEPFSGGLTDNVVSQPNANVGNREGAEGGVGGSPGVPESESSSASRPETTRPSAVNISFSESCVQEQQKGNTDTGAYILQPAGLEPTALWCDMKSGGGGWMVFQRRMDGREEFFRPWQDYVNGFGDQSVYGEFWLGLETLHLITSSRPHTLRVDLRTFDGVEGYAVYRHFRVESSRHKYALRVLGYSGTAGDALEVHHNQQFSTWDKDNDGWTDGDCSQNYRSAWWYAGCRISDLNAPYSTGSDGIMWLYGHEVWGAGKVAFVEMKLRPV